jgi:16S rRNA (guanine527-N7)-methyltransferase
MNKLEFQKHVNDAFKNISPTFFETIEAYKTFLNESNQTLNLTRLNTEDKIYGEYFFESIIPYKSVDFSKINFVLDIGSGSGIPGIILKILYPHINLTIIEANTKKCVFLKQLSEQLSINVQILNQRAENIENTQREMFDLVTSRAVTILPILLEISLPYVKVGGMLIEPKSKMGKQEINGVEKNIINLGGRLEKILEFSSINNRFHMVIFVAKVKKTDHSFPRK